MLEIILIIGGVALLSALSYLIIFHGVRNAIDYSKLCIDMGDKLDREVNRRVARRIDAAYQSAGLEMPEEIKNILLKD